MWGKDYLKERHITKLKRGAVWLERFRDGGLEIEEMKVQDAQKINFIKYEEAIWKGRSHIHSSLTVDRITKCHLHGFKSFSKRIGPVSLNLANNPGTGRSRPMWAMYISQWTEFLASAFWIPVLRPIDNGNAQPSSEKPPNSGKCCVAGTGPALRKSHTTPSKRLRATKHHSRLIKLL